MKYTLGYILGYILGYVKYGRVIVAFIVVVIVVDAVVVVAARHGRYSSARASGGYTERKDHSRSVHIQVLAPMHGATLWATS